MLISELEAQLKALREKHGNLPVFIPFASKNVDGQFARKVNFKEDLEFYDNEGNDQFEPGILIE